MMKVTKTVQDSGNRDQSGNKTLKKTQAERKTDLEIPTIQLENSKESLPRRMTRAEDRIQGFKNKYKIYAE